MVVLTSMRRHRLMCFECATVFTDLFNYSDHIGLYEHVDQSLLVSESCLSRASPGGQCGGGRLPT